MVVDSANDMADLCRLDAEGSADFPPSEPSQLLGEIDRGFLVVSTTPSR